MEEKNPIKINLTTLLLILAIIIIVFMAFYIYTEKQNTNKEFSKLEDNAIAIQNAKRDTSHLHNRGVQ